MLNYTLVFVYISSFGNSRRCQSNLTLPTGSLIFSTKNAIRNFNIWVVFVIWSDLKNVPQQNNWALIISVRTTAFLSTQNIELMDHPPYSPDLAPNDFFLFPDIKNKLRGQRFSTPEEAVEAFKMYVLELSVSVWKKCF